MHKVHVSSDHSVQVRTKNTQSWVSGQATQPMQAILQAKHSLKKMVAFCSECRQTTMRSRHDGKTFVQAVVVVQALGAHERSCDPFRLYSEGSSFRKRISLSSSVA